MNWKIDLNSFSYGPHCKKCGSRRVVRNGRCSKRGQKFKCKRCGCRAAFNSSDIYRMRKPAALIAEALRLYATVGISLRSIGRMLKVSHTTVARWVRKLAETAFPRLQPRYSPSWNFDETYVRINKVWHWLGVVLCGTTRLVLAWKIRKQSNPEEIVSLFKEAIENAGFRPQEIVTDGCFHYPWKIKKAFGWRFVKHRVEKGLGHNQKIERHFREVKRRLKWFSSFRTMESAEAFFRMYFFAHNFLKPHRGIGLQTPAQSAGLKSATVEGLLRPLVTS